VIIESNPYVFKKPLFLGSTAKGLQTYSPISRLQEASMHANKTYLSQWIIDHPDPNYRLEKQGEPVKLAESVLIRHAQTQHYLASNNVRYAKNYGGECEVMCHSFATSNKTQNLALESNGDITTDVPTKFQLD